MPLRSLYTALSCSSFSKPPCRCHSRQVLFTSSSREVHGCCEASLVSLSSGLSLTKEPVSRVDPRVCAAARIAESGFTDNNHGHAGSRPRVSLTESCLFDVEPLRRYPVILQRHLFPKASNCLLKVLFSDSVSQL